jgi:hypothetical protein
MGHTVNYKTYSTSYKDRNRKQNPKEKQMVFENTHEAIIPPETWYLVQKLRQTARRSKSDWGEPNRLTGLMFCRDCGSKMYNNRSNHKGKSVNIYTCSAYSKKTTTCTMHFIKTEVAEQLILDAVREVSGFVKANKSAFIEMVNQTSATKQSESAKLQKKQLAQSEKRITELDRLIRGIYEDKISGTLSEKRFLKLSQEYESEQEQLEQIVERLQSEADTAKDQSAKVAQFVELVERYTEFDELSTPQLNEFIHKVVIHEREKGYRYTTKQRVDIHFNFIGKFELPQEPNVEIATPPKSAKRYVAKGTSFAPFAEYLQEQNSPVLNLTLGEIESIIGKKLCASAYKYQSYWYPADNRPVANVIYNAGYDVKSVDVKSGIITLENPMLAN